MYDPLRVSLIVTFFLVLILEWDDFKIMVLTGGIIGGISGAIISILEFGNDFIVFIFMIIIFTTIGLLGSLFGMMLGILIREAFKKNYVLGVIVVILLTFGICYFGGIDYLSHTFDTNN